MIDVVAFGTASLACGILELVLPPAERTVWFRSAWLAAPLVLNCAEYHGVSYR